MRKDETESQKAMFAAAEAKAKSAKTKQGRPEKGREKKQGNVSLVSGGQTRDEAGDEHGISGRTVSKALDAS